ncbi:hypothetical protein HPHPA17_0970 [Helicobacter pylori Hp A-17]|nr:hypothetical protein HPHPA17_0970 [Helicobacter pylori Hp A-17]
MVILTNFNLLVTFSNLFLKKGFLNTNYKKLNKRSYGVDTYQIKAFYNLALDNMVELTPR